MKNLRTISLLFSIYLILLAGTAGYNKWTKQFFPTKIYHAGPFDGCDKPSIFKKIREWVQEALMQSGHPNAPYQFIQTRFVEGTSPTFFPYHCKVDPPYILGCAVMHLRARYRDTSKPTNADLISVANNRLLLIEDLDDHQNPGIACIMNNWITQIKPMGGTCNQCWSLVEPDFLKYITIHPMQESIPVSVIITVLTNSLKYYKDLHGHCSFDCDPKYNIFIYKNRGVIVQSYVNEVGSIQSMTGYIYGLRRDTRVSSETDQQMAFYLAYPVANGTYPGPLATLNYEQINNLSWVRLVQDTTAGFDNNLPICY